MTTYLFWLFNFLWDAAINIILCTDGAPHIHTNIDAGDPGRVIQRDLKRQMTQNNLSVCRYIAPYRLVKETII